MQHVVSSCIVSLNEKGWNWRHDSILINIARCLLKIQTAKVYCDVENSEFPTPSVITGDEERPDLVVMKGNQCLILELTVGFETNLEKNSKRKLERYKNLIRRLKGTYEVIYADLSMGCVGVIGKGNSEFQQMLKQQGLKYKDLQKLFTDFGLEIPECDYLIRKMINVCIRTTYYIFCQRNKQWDAPVLLAW